MEEKEIKKVSDFEVGQLQSMCEIRFDCLVSMFEMGVKTVQHGLVFMEEKPLKPQWFKIESKITLETIRHCDEYEIGRQLKQMLAQLDEHIKKYENK